MKQYEAVFLIEADTKEDFLEKTEIIRAETGYCDGYTDSGEECEKGVNMALQGGVI